MNLTFLFLPLWCDIVGVGEVIEPALHWNGKRGASLKCEKRVNLVSTGMESVVVTFFFGGEGWG